MGYGGLPGELAWGVLLIGFGYAALSDWRTREAPDLVWQLLGIGGALLGGFAVAPGGALPLLAWASVSLLVLEHFFAWDVALERRSESLPGIVELAGYLAVGAFLFGVGLSRGFGDLSIPGVAIAAYLAIVLARVCFELGLLYGGADAKAMIAAASLVPLGPLVLVSVSGAAPIASLLPGPFTILMNAALASAVVPLGLAVRNLREGTFSGKSSFLGYTIPVAELPDRFVWLQDPLLARGSAEEEEVESTEDDRALRTRQRAELEARGITRVWVTPQLPFLVFFLVGALATLLFGNLLFDLLALI